MTRQKYPIFIATNTARNYPEGSLKKSIGTMITNVETQSRVSTPPHFILASELIIYYRNINKTYYINAKLSYELTLIKPLCF